MIVDCERVGKNEVVVCCDVEAKKRVFELMNEEPISREVLGNWVKSGVMELGVTKSEALKSGATRRHLPN